MLMPRIFEDDFFNDVFRTPVTFTEPVNRMKTDIKDMDDHYELELELPGYHKEDLKAELRDGNLTISAKREESKDEKDEKNRYVRRERYQGSCQRTFYVGKKLQQEDIKASFANGILTLMVPKQVKKAEAEKTLISIEG